MAFHSFLLETFLFSLIVVAAKEAAAATIAKPGCQDTCGNVSIPYPFGMGQNCYLNRWYEVSCNNNTPRLSSVEVANLSVEVLAIQLVGTVTIRGPIISTNCTNSGKSNYNVRLELGEGSPFSFSRTNKIVMVKGCSSVSGVSRSRSALSGCVINCTNPRNGHKSICETRDPENAKIFDRNVLNAFPGIANERCINAFLIDYNELDTYDKVQDVGKQTVPVSLEWGISEIDRDLFVPLKARSNENGTYRCGNYSSASDQKNKFLYCYCNNGYEGNPYLVAHNSGCQDVDECANRSQNLCPGKWQICQNTNGSYECSDKRLIPILIGASVSVVMIIALLGSWWLYKAIHRRKDTKLREHLFKQLLSEQQFKRLLSKQQSLSDGNAQDPPRLFKKMELKKATNNFKESRIIGQGGQGTVYKGMLEDGKIVAVKRTRFLDDRRVRQFINEIVILSQVNHRNVVKLLGCCLETESPLLVYEFVPNGTLFQHIHSQNDEFHLTWKARLRIAAEVAGGLAYLHSAASSPIYHRDIKSTNILLDKKFRAKLSDFGTSRSVSLDQTHLTTAVQGTFGYMDPEYLQSSQFTEKSDVYSFGVVLVELLTGLEPVFSIEPHGRISLATYFLSQHEENQLLQNLDERVSLEGGKEDIFAVANIAKRCLNKNGEARPTMKIVAAALEGISLLHGGLVTPDQQEAEYDESESESQSHIPLG